MTELYTISNCHIEHETDAAILVRLESSAEEYWIPLSQVERIKRAVRDWWGDEVVCTAWIARQKGLI